MLSAALLCTAGALLLWPPRRDSLPGPRPGRPWPGRAVLDALRGGQAPAAAAAAALVAVSASTPLVALLAAAGAWTAVSAWHRRQRRREEEARLHALAEALGALAADLRAGRSAPEASAAAVASCPDEVTAGALAAALRAPESVPTPGEPGGAWDDAVGRVAAVVRLSTRTGCSLAAVACAVEDDLRARLRQRQDLRTAVAAPRASATLLAALPLLALAMGSGIGADPWRVLTATPTGQVLLVAGASLEAAGLAWSSRLVRRALP